MDLGARSCKTLQLVFADSLLTTRKGRIARRSAIYNRIFHSLDVLMPYVVKFLDSHHSKFKLKFCFSDEGEDGFISFDRAFNTDRPIIPDLYSLADARTLRFYPIHTQEEFAPVFSRKRPKVFWRGSTTGSSMKKNGTDARNNPRVRACELIRGQLRRSRRL